MLREASFVFAVQLDASLPRGGYEQCTLFCPTLKARVGRPGYLSIDCLYLCWSQLEGIMAKLNSGSRKQHGQQPNK